MKILYLNIFEGCPEKWRFEKIVSFVKKNRPDVIGFSEANDWERGKTKKIDLFRKKTGFQHCIFLKSRSGYNLALFSNYRFENTLILKKGFRTGLIKAKILVKSEPIHIMLTHLHYKNENHRISEISKIVSVINKKEKNILMGDLNCLSPLDRYEEKKLIKNQNAVGLKKFGVKKIQKKAMKKLLKYGLIDIIKKLHTGFEYSVPTQFNKDRSHFDKLRLDYILITKNLVKYLREADIVRNKETNQLSDHFPIVATFKL